MLLAEGHRCQNAYQHHALAIDIEICHCVTEFKGIFRIKCEEYEDAFSFTIWAPYAMV